VIATLILALVLVAQTPDGRGEVALDAPRYQGVRASAPLRAADHVRNEGGSDGAGLCVISSVVANGHYQGVPGIDKPGPGTSNVPGQFGRVDDAPGKGSAIWRAAKARPGGYGPDKLAALVEKTMPGEKYASYTGRDPSILDSLSRKGLPIGATMSTGAFYNYRPIHHMISLVHYRAGQWACVVDNNDPGRFRWMPSAEFARRWIDGGIGWAWVWTRTQAFATAGAALPLILLAAALALVGIARRRIA
jgi:hypothetical protein